MKKKLLVLLLCALVAISFVTSYYAFRPQKSPTIINIIPISKSIKSEETLIPFIKENNYQYEKLEKADSKIYIENLYSDDIEISDLIIDNDSYKAVGANINININTFKNSIPITSIFNLNLVNSTLHLDNTIMPLDISGEFLINKSLTGFKLSAKGANIVSSQLDLTADIEIENKDISIKITRGFINTDLISSFNLSGNIQIKNDQISGIVNAPNIKIHNSDFTDLNLSLSGDSNKLEIKGISSNYDNSFDGKMEISLNNKELKETKISLNIKGKDTIKTSIKGEIPLSFNTIEIAKKSNLAGTIQGKLSSISFSNLLSSSSLEFDGKLKLEKGSAYFDSSKELKIISGINIKDYLNYDINSLTISPQKNSFDLSLYPNFDLSNAKIIANNKVRATIKKLSIDKENGLSGEINNISGILEKRIISTKFSSEKKLSGEATITGEFSTPNLHASDMEEKLSFEKDEGITTKLISFKAKHLEVYKPNITIHNISLQDGILTGKNVKLYSNVLSPMTLKVDLNKDVNGKLWNDTMSWNIKGFNSSDSISLLLSSESIKFSRENFPILDWIRRFDTGYINPIINFHISKKDYSVKGSGNINFKDITFDDEDYALSSLNYNLQFDNLYPLEMPEQNIKFAFLSFKDIELFTGNLELGLKNNILKLKQGKASFGEGKIYISESSSDLNSGEINIDTKIENCKLQGFLDLAKLQHLKSTGLVNGQLPIIYDFNNSKYKLDNGFLFTSENGHFSFKQIADKEIIIPDFNVEMTKGALENFYFDDLKLTIHKEYDKSAKVQAIFKGYSPEFWGGKRSALNLNFSPIFERVFK